MKSFVAILAIVAVVAADVSHIARHPEADAVIIKQEADVLPDAYNYEFETSNGINSRASAVLKSSADGEALAVQGSNSHTAPTGEKFVINYIADEYGYQPQGDHLPTTPAPQEIPEYILRSIEYIRTHPPKEEPLRRI